MSCVSGTETKTFKKRNRFISCSISFCYFFSINADISVLLYQYLVNVCFNISMALIQEPDNIFSLDRILCS